MLRVKLEDIDILYDLVIKSVTIAYLQQLVEMDINDGIICEKTKFAQNCALSRLIQKQYEVTMQIWELLQKDDFAQQ